MCSIIRCTCGAQVRLPQETVKRVFRCPQCKLGFALTTEGKVLPSFPAGSPAAGANCPICQSDINANEFVVTCPNCDQIHHRECWGEVGGCGTYGCEQAPTPEKAPADEQPLSAWGDTKTCPVCKETIKAIALKCRYCGADFGTVDPLTADDLRRRVRKGQALKSLQKTVITLFVLSLIGCLAPLVAIVSMCMLLPKHRELAKEGPLYLVLGYSSITLSVVYSVLMVLFAVF